MNEKDVALTQQTEQKHELACRVCGCDKVSEEGIMEIMNDKPNIMNAIMNAMTKNEYSGRSDL